MTASSSAVVAAPQENQLPPAEQSQSRVLTRAGRFIVGHWIKLATISILLLIPCFWHRYIEAGDLGSHVYNAWLAQLIARGQAPGLWLAHPTTNVLFDYMLTVFGDLFGLHAAEKNSVALSVLAFFWGAFALVAASARHAPWYFTPALAMIAYGWTFEMGFFNYYLSLGLSFFALAILWRGSGWDFAAAIALVPFIYLAHPLGLIWLVAAAIYVRIAEGIPSKTKPVWAFAAGIALVFVAALVLLLLRIYLWRHFIVAASDDPLYFFNGGDQLLLFGDRYNVVEILLGIFIAGAVIADLIARRRSGTAWRAYAIPLQLYVIAEIAVFLLPDGVRPPNQSAALALLTERLTSVSAVLICCVLGAMLPREWHLAALAGITLCFFALLYRDTAVINRIEAQVEELIQTLPPGQRVMATILKPDESRVLVQHIVDRACIEHCFSYGNYEPSSGVFRVCALPGNRYVMTDFGDVGAMESGEYVVKPEDLPAYQIYQCEEGWTQLCIRPLVAGEANDRLDVHPDE